MRDRETLNEYRRDIGHTDDVELCDLLDRLLAGDESVRAEVEFACDQIDSDAKRYEALQHPAQ